jgi:hypothetical protein
LRDSLRCTVKVRLSRRACDGFVRQHVPSTMFDEHQRPARKLFPLLNDFMISAPGSPFENLGPGMTRIYGVAASGSEVSLAGKVRERPPVFVIGPDRLHLIEDSRNRLIPTGTNLRWL